MLIRKQRYIILILTVTVVIFTSITIILFWLRQQYIISFDSTENFPPTPEFTEFQNELFIDSIARSAELNTGISMHRSGFLKPVNAPLPSPNNVILVVLNHLEEKVSFMDQSFELKAYYFDEATSQWQRIELPQAARVKTTLPPKTETVDFDIPNSWNVHEKEVEDSPSDELRLYISGIGEETGKTYGAYLDVRLIQE
jgi:hypothetical protein